MTTKPNINLITELTNIIINPGLTDKQGRTALDLRADKIRQLPGSSPDKIFEENLIIEVLKKASIFDGPQISRIINYIKHSGFSENKISIVCVEVLNTLSLNAFQLIEFLRYVLTIVPDKIHVDLILQGLSGIKPIKPWLYTEILSLKAPYMALDFTVYLMQSDQFNSSSFQKLFLKWVESNDLDFLKSFSTKIYPLLKDSDTISLIEYKYKEKGILYFIQKDIIPKLHNVPRSFVLSSSTAFKDFKNDLILDLNTKYIPEYAT